MSIDIGNEFPDLCLPDDPGAERSLGDMPEVGAAFGRSDVYSRPHVVHEVERSDERVAIRLRRAAR